MARLRTKIYYDISLKEDEIKWLKKGYAVHRCITVNKSQFGVSITLNNRKIHREMQKLKARISELKLAEKKSKKK